MTVGLKLVVIYLAVSALLYVCCVGKRVEVTPFGAMLKIVIHGLMIWAIFAAVH